MSLINQRYTEQDWKKYYLADESFSYDSNDTHQILHKPTGFLLGIMRGRYVTHNWPEIKENDYLFTAFCRTDEGGVSKCGRTPYEAIKILADFMVNHTSKQIRVIQQQEEDALREYAKFKMLQELLKKTNNE